MPITPLHYVAAYLIYKSAKHPHSKVKLNFPALIVGSFTPDLEIPFFWFLTHSIAYDRLILHSLIGGGIIGTLIATLLTLYVYPWLVRNIFNLKIKNQNKFSLNLVFSAFLGVLSHVIIDALHHPYNPLFYPFTSQNVGNLVLFQNPDLASFIIHLFFLFLLAEIVFYEKKNSKNFWESMLLN